MVSQKISIKTALIIVDVQKGIDDPYWAKDGPRNGPDGEANIPVQRTRRALRVSV